MPALPPSPIAPPTSINIGPYSFPVTPGYSSGEFPVTPTELASLDLLRSERVRKKGFKLLEKLLREAGGAGRTLSDAQLRLLSDEVAKFDREVRLERSGPAVAADSRPGAPPGPDGVFDTELRRLAEMRLDAEERLRGVTLAPEAREAALVALRSEPLLREQARERVEVVLREREKLLAAALATEAEELF